MYFRVYEWTVGYGHTLTCTVTSADVPIDSKLSGAKAIFFCSMFVQHLAQWDPDPRHGLLGDITTQTSNNITILKHTIFFKLTDKI